MIRNNHGWSLKEMLFLTSILVLAMLVVVVLVNSLYNSLEGTKSSEEKPKSYSYQEVEKNLSDAAKRYYKKEESNLITSDDLMENKYIDIKKLTAGSDICEGYVLVEEKEFTPFITCTNYETEGY